MNAQWKVQYQRLNDNGIDYLYLASTDLADVKKAHARAQKVAKERLTKKGLKVRILRSECVG